MQRTQLGHVLWRLKLLKNHLFLFLDRERSRRYELIQAKHGLVVLGTYAVLKVLEAGRILAIAPALLGLSVKGRAVLV